MNHSTDPILDSVCSLEDDFAEAMTRMYAVGNDLARLRSRLAMPAPEQQTPVEPSAPLAAAAPFTTAPFTTATSQPSPPEVAPGFVTPPPVTLPGPPHPPGPPLPPVEPWWQRDGLVAKVLAVVGTAITLIGVAFLLALAIQMGFFGPLARVLSGALLAIALVGAAVIVRRRPAGTIGALGLAATGFATAYLDVFAVTRVYEWLPVGVGMLVAGLIALAGVLLARTWDSQLLAIVAVLGVSLLAPFVGPEHGVLTGAFLLVLTAATWPAQVGRRWHALELARIAPTTLFLTLLAGLHDTPGVPALLGGLLAVLVLGTSLAGARVARLPQQIGALVPVAVAPCAISALAVEDRWTGAGLFLAITCLLVLVAGLADHPEGTPTLVRLSELALATAGLTSVCAALRAGEGQGWTSLLGVSVCLLWALAALALRHRTTLCVALAVSSAALLGAISLLPQVLLRSLSEEVGGRHVLTTVGLVVLLAVLARGVSRSLPSLAPALPRVLVTLSVLWCGAAVVLLGALAGQQLDDAPGGFTVGQAGATVLWMAIAAVLLLRGLRGSTVAVPAGLALASLSVGKLLLFDLSFLGGIARVLCFIVAGLLLLGMGAGYAQALERTRRGSRPGPVDKPAGPEPMSPTV